MRNATASEIMFGVQFDMEILGILLLLKHAHFSLCMTCVSFTFFAHSSSSFKCNGISRKAASR